MTITEGPAAADGLLVHNSQHLREPTCWALMQSQPPLYLSMIEFAERHHGDAEIVSSPVEGDIHRLHLP